jgi:hypothetical protein
MQQDDAKGADSMVKLERGASDTHTLLVLLPRVEPLKRKVTQQMVAGKEKDKQRLLHGMK